jgi:Rad3-related DNA helicase
VPLSPGIHGVFRKKLKKLIILSATINEIDVAELKIGRGNRICKIELKSIIPPERRPIVRQYVGAINFYNMNTMAPKIAAMLIDIASYHPGKKGLAHVTYGLSLELEKALRHDPRFMFHTKIDAKARLAEWMKTKDKIFIAAGFSEGLDLKGEEYEWQAICKIGWPSLADSAIKKRSEANPKWYIWQTLKDTLQRVGRICRGPEDYGVTYVLDKSFDRLVSEAKQMELLPGYFPEVE